MLKALYALLATFSLFACSSSTNKNFNKPPFAINLTQSVVGENNVGAEVGRLSTQDPNSGDTFSYEIVEGHPDVFEIDGDVMKLANTFSADFEVRSSYSVERRSTDQGGLSFNEVFDIRILDSNERPFYNEFSSMQGIDIVIGYGQSNISGHGYESLEAPSDVGKNKLVKLCMVDCTLEGDFSSIEYQSISDPSDIYSKGLYSLWGAFNNHHDEEIQRPFVLVNAGRSGYTLSWLSKNGPEDQSYAVSTNAFQTLVSSVKQVIYDFGDQQINSVSVIWLQGEAEAMEFSGMPYDQINQYFTYYFDNLEKLKEDLEAELDIPHIFFFINRVGNIDPEIRSADTHNLVNDLGFWQIQFCASNEDFIPLSVVARSFRI